MAELDIAIGDSIVIENKLDLALQELDIMFNTEKTELLGDTSFGSLFERFLWEMNQPEQAVKNYIYEVMKDSYYFSAMVDTINVQMIDGEYRPIYIIQIILKDNETNKRKYRTYKFQ